MRRKPTEPSQAAIDLGFVPPDPTDRSMQAFQIRAATLLIDAQQAHGAAASAALFERLAELSRALAKPQQVPRPESTRRAPPRKQKGRPHNASEDANLLALWRNAPYSSKQEFAREIMARKLVRTIDEKSLVKHLNRLLAAKQARDK